MNSIDNSSIKFNKSNIGASTLKHGRIPRKGGVMHKVRSMECVSFNGLEFKGTWTTTCKAHPAMQRNEKASKFSGYASSTQR